MAKEIHPKNDNENAAQQPAAEPEIRVYDTAPEGAEEIAAAEIEAPAADEPKAEKAGAAREAAPAKPKKAKNKKARLIVALLIVALLVATVLTVLNLRLFSDGTSIDNDWKTPSYLRDKTMNILVCGVDYDVNDEGHQETMTDVIMVVNLDMEADKATILQIPRDTYVGEDLVFTGKINALYNWGYLDEPAGAGGIGQLIETINDQFKLPIDHYVTISMEGFRKAVDMLGGVDVTIEKEMTINVKDKDENIIDTIVLEPGTHTLSGELADHFVRNRDYTQADIERVNVQRYFLAALMNKATALSTSELVSLANAIYPYLETDFSIQELISLAMEAKNLSGDSVTAVRIPVEYIEKYGKWGLDVLTVHRADLADMLNEYMRPYSDPVPETDLEVIEIQNKDDSLNTEGESLGEYGA